MDELGLLGQLQVVGALHGVSRHVGRQPHRLVEVDRLRQLELLVRILPVRVRGRLAKAAVLLSIMVSRESLTVKRFSPLKPEILL